MRQLSQIGGRTGRGESFVSILKVIPRLTVFGNNGANDDDDNERRLRGQQLLTDDVENTASRKKHIYPAKCLFLSRFREAY